MSVNASQYSYAASALDKLLADLKARIGVFLGNQKAVQDALARAQAVASASSGTVKQSAGALVAKGQALLKIQADAEVTATTMLAQAAEVKAKATTPLYSFLTTNPLEWGWRQGELLVALVSDTSKMASAAAQLATRIQKQNGDVATFVKEVTQIERAATGTGALPTISAFIGSTVGASASALSKMLWPLAVVAGVGGMIYLTAPQLLRGRK
jgi:hypothetical protein